MIEGWRQPQKCMHFAAVLNYIGLSDALSMKAQGERRRAGMTQLDQRPKNCKKVSAADRFFRYAIAQ
jgi:hypothetical protein